MNADKVIHEARGLCWHEAGEKLIEFKTHNRSTFLDYPCVKCREPSQAWTLNPDYTDPVHYCDLFNWLRKDGRILVLGSWWFDRTGENFDSFMELPVNDEVILISEAILDGVLS